ncbi:MAG TPA: PD-(D/E)XK nuclease family protein [Gemmataceae bacterium]|nr:PD-(D/E)XK nuclease family protein [Gemmataceae bacterium]
MELPEVAASNLAEEFAPDLPEVSEPPPPDEPVKSKEEKFLDDLRLVFSSIPVVREPHEFLADLASYFELHRQKRTARLGEFDRDLRLVYASIAPGISDTALQALADRFDAWRAQIKNQLATFFAQLPADDPLRCPISLFGVMQHGRVETAHTAVLAWFLDPRKEHGFEDSVLRSLLEHLIDIAETDSIVVEKLHSEYPIEDGRLDVVIQGRLNRAEGNSSKWLVLIEAKIDAAESDRQLRKYDRWVQKVSHGREVFRIFLTPDGRPAESSEEDWIPMSFLELACVVRKKYGALTDRAGYHFLRHYLAGILKDICHWDLPIHGPDKCVDPYNFVDYLKTVHAS